MRRKHKLQIEGRDEGQDDRGRPVKGSWKKVSETWGEFIELRGNEAVAARMVFPTAGLSIRIRRLPWLKTRHRFRTSDNRVFNIGFVGNDPNDIHYDNVLCSEER